MDQPTNSGGRHSRESDAPDGDPLKPELEDRSVEVREKQHHSHWSRLKQSWKQTTIGNKLIVIFTLVIAVSNFFYVLYARWQLNVMSSQLAEMARQYPELHTSAIAARDAADAAKDAVDAQARQFKIDERPYITAEYIKIGGRPQLGTRLAGEVLLRNAGKTPALEGHIFVRIDILAKEPCCPDDWERQARLNPSGGDIGSNLQRAMTALGHDPLNQDWFGRLAKDSKLYVFGAYVYRDVFGESHATDFCAFYIQDSIQELALWACHAKRSNEVK